MPEPAPEQLRLDEAVVSLMAERGYERMTVASVVERAGVTRDDFDRHFADIEDAVLRVYSRYADEFIGIVLAAYEAEASWRDGLRAGAYAAADYVDHNHELITFGTVRMFGAGLMAQTERAGQLQRLVDLIDAGRQELDAPDSMGRWVAEGVFGSVYELLIKEVLADGSKSAADFVPELMYIAVRPYLGHEVAREELDVPPPTAGGGPTRTSVHPRTETRHATAEASTPRYVPTVVKGQGPGDEAALRLARLPPGRHGLPREFVTQNQRDRLAAGTIAVVAERGLNAATITQICAAAGVSRRTFYTYFPSKEACFFAAYATIAEHLRLATDAAAAEHEEWAPRIVAKLQASLEFFAANPDLARFSLIAPQRAGEAVTLSYRRTMGQAVTYLCEGMPPPPATRAPSEAVAASLIGGMVALLVRKVEADEGDDLPALLPDLVELFLTPYIGRAEAVEIARASG